MACGRDRHGAGLVLLLGLIGIAQARRWHERWIGYRLLAELFRKQGAMALLGWSLPVLKAGESARPGAHWLAWYFEAVTRAAPLATGTLAGADLGRISDAVSNSLVAGPIDYHTNDLASSAGHLIASATTASVKPGGMAGSVKSTASGAYPMTNTRTICFCKRQVIEHRRLSHAIDPLMEGSLA